MKILVGVATYNEAENIERLIAAIHRHLPGRHILVLDDNSPDGTARLVEELAALDSRIILLKRPGKLGLGSATFAMMSYAIDKGFDALIVMDADFSHDPRSLPLMAELLERNDFVTGSRYVEGGKCEYGLYRTLVSKAANWGARRLAGIELRECTTAYRGFKTSLLKRLPLAQIKSTGYSFQVEVLYHIVRHTDKTAECPILFADRAYGESKINKKEMMMSVLTLLRLFRLRIADKR